LISAKAPVFLASSGVGAASDIEDLEQRR